MWRALRGPPEIMSEPARPSHDTQLRGLIYRSATTSGVVPSVAALAEWSAIDQGPDRDLVRLLW